MDSDRVRHGERPLEKDLGFPGLPRVFPTVVHSLADAAERAPDATALVCGDERLTYVQYLRCVAGFARELGVHGVRGERVALVCANSLELPIAMFAVHAAGAQAVPINPGYTERELGLILRDAGPAAVVYDSPAAERVEPLAAELGIRVSVRLGGSGDRSLVGGKDAAATLPLPLPEPSSLATLQYTGGTTGQPKGVDITHGQMAVNVAQREAALPTRPDDECILCPMPLYHVFAVAMCLHLAVYCRGRLVVMPRYRPDELLALLEREGVTRLAAGPTIFIGLLDHPRLEATDFSRLRSAWSGSAPLPEQTLRCWQERTGTPILEGYGQTEAGPVLTYAREGAALRPGSVGPALPLTEVQIVDVETGTRRLGIGELGEIRARGPQIMSGYRNRADETAQTLREGWLYTGDIGELDAGGNLYIRDRKKDMAIVGGFNVYPREVDEVLFAHPEVADAATVGVPDPYYGEALHSFVVLRDGSRVGTDQLIEHCRRQLARYKVPRAIEVAQSLPRTAVGKLDRAALRIRLAGREAPRNRER